MSSREAFDALGNLIQACLQHETDSRRPAKLTRRRLLKRAATRRRLIGPPLPFFDAEPEGETFNAPSPWIELGWRELALACALRKVGPVGNPSGHFR